MKLLVSIDNGFPLHSFIVAEDRQLGRRMYSLSTAAIPSRRKHQNEVASKPRRKIIMRDMVSSDLALLKAKRFGDAKLMAMILHMDIYLGPVQEPSPRYILKCVEDSYCP